MDRTVYAVRRLTQPENTSTLHPRTLLNMERKKSSFNLPYFLLKYSKRHERLANEGNHEITSGAEHHERRAKSRCCL